MVKVAFGDHNWQAARMCKIFPQLVWCYKKRLHSPTIFLAGELFKIRKRRRLEKGLVAYEEELAEI